jgi:hypothetical protein
MHIDDMLGSKPLPIDTIPKPTLAEVRPGTEYSHKQRPDDFYAIPGSHQALYWV